MAGDPTAAFEQSDQALQRARAVLAGHHAGLSKGVTTTDSGTDASRGRTGGPGMWDVAHFDAVDANRDGVVDRYEWSMQGNKRHASREDLQGDWGGAGGIEGGHSSVGSSKGLSSVPKPHGPV